jgi:hypothetical protein
MTLSPSILTVERMYVFCRKLLRMRLSEAPYRDSRRVIDSICSGAYAPAHDTCAERIPITSLGISARHGKGGNDEDRLFLATLNT